MVKVTFDDLRAQQVSAIIFQCGVLYHTGFDFISLFIITRNRGHFEPVNNCQQYIMSLSRTIKSNMAALIALSERKCVSYDLL